jgi:hypothetical protein
VSEGVTPAVSSNQREKGEVIAGKKTLTGGTGMSAGERREGHTPSGFAGMGRGPNLAWAGLVSPWPFLLLFYFFLFSVSVF